MVSPVSVLVFATLVASSLAEIRYSSRALEDQVRHLPGAPHVNFKMFAGYVNIENGDVKKDIFFWLVEVPPPPFLSSCNKDEQAEKNAEAAPLVLWTNGGPGCSGEG